MIAEDEDRVTCVLTQTSKTTRDALIVAGLLGIIFLMETIIMVNPSTQLLFKCRLWIMDLGCHLQGNMCF